MKPLRLFTFHLVCLTVSLTFLANVTQAEDTLKTTEAKTRPSQRARLIQFANDHLTVNVKDRSLQELLQEIARQSGLIIVGYGSSAERITIEFHQLPLEEGLRRILRHQSFAVEYARLTPKESRSTVLRPKRLWILSKAKNGSPVQTTLVDNAKAGYSLEDVATDSPKIEAALTSDDALDRMDAIEALGESGRPEAVEPLSLALKDEDEDVREAAITALANIGGDEAAQALAIALQDKDTSVREEAVEALGEIGGESVILLLEQALADEDEYVRETAAELLASVKDQP